MALVWASPGLPPDVSTKKAQIGGVGRGTLPPDESTWGSSVHNEQGSREVLDSSTATYYQKPKVELQSLQEVQSKGIICTTDGRSTVISSRVY